MNKILFGMLALGLMATFSSPALEKPSTPEADYELYRIQQALGEQPQARVLRKRISQLQAQARASTGALLQQLNAAIAEYEKALQTNMAEE